jgi:hypothetical protein
MEKYNSLESSFVAIYTWCYKINNINRISWPK